MELVVDPVASQSLLCSCRFPSLIQKQINNQFFSHTNNDNHHQNTSGREKVQNTDYNHSYSIGDARRNAGLDAECSLDVDLGLLKVEGSAKHLNNKQPTTFEARVDVTCTVVRRKVVQMPYKDHLNNALCGGSHRGRHGDTELCARV